MNQIISGLAVILFVICWVLIIKKNIDNKNVPVKSVKAQVFDKYKTDTVSRIQGTFKRERYVVVFLAGTRKLSFDVSEFSYNSYKLNKKGTLKYKGHQLISFK